MLHICAADFHSFNIWVKMCPACGIHVFSVTALNSDTSNSSYPHTAQNGNRWVLNEWRRNSWVCIKNHLWFFFSQESDSSSSSSLSSWRLRCNSVWLMAASLSICPRVCWVSSAKADRGTGTFSSLDLIMDCSASSSTSQSTVAGSHFHRAPETPHL